MTTKTVALIDPSHRVLAVASVAKEGDHYGGAIDLQDAPDSLRALFAEFEEIVNGQMFSFLDDIQEKIASFGIKVVFENGLEVDIKDLQVFPSTGDMSFKFANDDLQRDLDPDESYSAEEVLSELEESQKKLDK